MKGEKFSIKPQESASDFIRKSYLGLALVGLTLLTPFAVNNLMHGRYFLGVGAFAIIAVLAFNAWMVVRYNRYYTLLTFLGLVPAILFFLSLSMLRQGMIGVLWAYPAVLSFYFMLPERRAWIANLALIVIVFPLAWNIIEQALAMRLIATLSMVSIFSAIFIRAITEQQNKLKTQAVTDPLTGLLNRSLLHGKLDWAVAQSKRTGIPMTLISFDIDHFKSINDTFGHDVGDKVLRSVSHVFKLRFRRSDKVFRLGGEEFLLLLYDTNIEDGKQVSEEIRQSIAALKLLPDQAVTVSTGVATLRPEEDWKQWIKRSDANLYRAKTSGRNRTVA
ncbi:GGDEF domain-containing protein [Vasconcelosia minhoensis]|nr:GGDEF domain-containing protein [Romeria gracilis]